MEGREAGREARGEEAGEARRVEGGCIVECASVLFVCMEPFEKGERES